MEGDFGRRAIAQKDGAPSFCLRAIAAATRRTRRAAAACFAFGAARVSHLVSAR